MQICSRCLYPSTHPFGIIFDDKGVCSGCRIHEEKDSLPWDQREDKLSKILDNYRNSSKVNYDCIIPVSGGKDSYFIVDIVKNKFKMNPLLVSYNTHFNTLTGIRNLQNLKTRFGCDLIQLNLNPKETRDIAKFTFEKIASIYWHNHAGNTVFPVQMAVKLKIPLIIWGLHQGVDQVGMFSHTDEVEMTRKYRKEHDLMGLEPEDLHNDLECPKNIKNTLKKLFYPSNEEIRNIQVRGIYLSNYIRWDSKSQHESMIDKYGYRTVKQNRTFNPYEDTHSVFYNDVHDYIKYMKLGYSKVLDHAVQEIRLKRMSRGKGVQSLREYKNVDISSLGLLLDYLSITEDEFYLTLDKFKYNPTEMVSNRISENLLKEVALEFNKSANCNFIVNEVAKDSEGMHSFYKGIYL
jgi:N-acetyl sugar amidotransferase